MTLLALKQMAMHGTTLALHGRFFKAFKYLDVKEFVTCMNSNDRFVSVITVLV